MFEGCFNTRDYRALSPQEYKQQAVANWSSAPCGSIYGDSELEAQAYFSQIEEWRHGSHPWIREAITGFGIRGKNVLEIGFGMGTDHLDMARRGARMYGIDLTPANHEITRRLFELHGYQSRLVIGDAENLPYPDNSMDFVYSCGVIHHCPDAMRVISEIHRVLKPGGRCWIAVYHKNSIVFWWTILLFSYVLRKGFRKRTLKQQLSLVEYPHNNEDIVVQLYTRNEIARDFAAFSEVRTSIRHLLPCDIAFFHRFFSKKDRPNRLLDAIGRRLGWYVIVEAAK